MISEKLLIPVISSTKVKWTNLPPIFQKNNKLNNYQSLIISDNSQLSLLPTLRVNCLKVKLDMFEKNVPVDLLLTICSFLRKYDIYIDNTNIVINASSLIDFFVKLLLVKLTLTRRLHAEAFNEYYFSILIFVEDGGETGATIGDRLEIIEKFCLSP